MPSEQFPLKLHFPFVIRVTGLLSVILSLSLFFVLPRFTGETVQENYDQINTFRFILFLYEIEENSNFHKN